MNEYFIELLDANETAYGCTDLNGDEMYFEDLEEARLYAKGQVNEIYTVVKVIDAGTHHVVDYFVMRG